MSLDSGCLLQPHPSQFFDSWGGLGGVIICGDCDAMAERLVQSSHVQKKTMK